MYKAKVRKHTLEFKKPSGTSRGILIEKDSWIIEIWEEKNASIIGMGEASIIKTLSPDWNVDYVSFLEKVVNSINDFVEGDLNNPKINGLIHYPSIYFAIEMALLDLKNGGKKILFPSAFTKNKASIKINGLIWMGKKEDMLAQIKNKIALGYDCIKLKIGAIDFEAELDLIRFIRTHYSKNEIELRVDANGAFTAETAFKKLKLLADFDLHSIEQPIKQGQIEAMKKLCSTTPLPIALDEELIGIIKYADKVALLEKIKPQYIILKPSLIGGFKGSNEWINIAENLGIKWWITSALESNIGLNAIAQFTYTKDNPLPQGLGTGQLYTNNIPSGLKIMEGRLYLVDS